MVRLTTFALGLSIVVAAAACGGDGSPPEPEAQPAGSPASATGAGAVARDPAAASDRAPLVPPPPPPEPHELAAERPRPPADPQVIAQLRTAAEAAPGDATARRRFGIALIHAGRHDEGIALFERAVASDPSPRNQLDLALAQTAAARLDDAAATYERLLGIAPGDAVALHNLGNLALRKGDLAQAEARYRAALESDPAYLLAQAHLGDVLRQSGRYEEAYRAYEAVLELEPRGALEVSAMDDALYRLASLDLQMGAPQRAAQLLAELLRANPEHAHAYYAMGQALMQLGHTEQARQAFDAHVRLLERQPATGPMAADE